MNTKDLETVLENALETVIDADIKKATKRVLRQNKGYYQRAIEHMEKHNMGFCFSELGEMLTIKTCKSSIVALNS